MSKFLFSTAAFLICFSQMLFGINYNKDIRPILSDKCLGCHGSDAHEAKGDLQLHSFEAATRPLGKDKDRWAIYPKNLEKSELWYRITTDDVDDIMPPEDSHKTLSAAEKQLIKQWIEAGAEYDEHWSFKPLSAIEVPEVEKKAWAQNPIDHFVLDKCKTAKLEVSKKAAPGVLIRRLYLDLTGLPAPVAVMEAFEKNPSAEHYKSIVEQLLNSPQYAERMALDWLDSARYADTNGYSIDDHRDMWAWRDWVINAFATNKPYNEFILEQVAGDLIPEATVQQKVATGFLRNSMSTHEGGTIAEEYRVAYNKDKVDVVGTAIMGMTMKCAQCHDHKYDPISKKEYYQFYAYFNTSSESGRGGANGNAKPTINSTTAYCDEERLKAEMDLRILDLEKSIISSIPDYESKKQQWEKGIISKVKLAQKNSQSVKIIKAALKPAPVDKLFWIWSEKPVENKKVEFSKTFTLGELPQSAFLESTCDNSATIWINNKKIGSVKDWDKPLSIDVIKPLRLGENKIKVVAQNDSGPGGFIFKLNMTVRDEPINLYSDNSWDVKIDGQKEFKKAVNIEPYKKGPWGEVFSELPRLEMLYSLIMKGSENLNIEERLELREAMFKDLKLNSIYATTVNTEIDVLKKVKDQGTISTQIMDYKPRDTFVLIRGAYDQPGEKVEPGLPAFLPKPSAEESVPNRLGLAKWLTRADHPLTSRVLINRVWQMLMGRGLVETSEDFGSQGSWPVHEKLLNYLAYDFVQNGWDVKRLIKNIVTSSTYQQSSKATAEQLEKDPRNELYARAPRFRLAAELIRDNALTHAQLLNPKIGGPSVFPDQPDNLWKEISHYGYPKPFTAQVFVPSKGKDLYRRSLYTFWKRTMSPPSMTIFDAPTRETCSVRRLTTNTPLQALVLMNDPQFFNAAQEYGNLLYQNPEPFDKKVQQAYLQVTGRHPQQSDAQTLRQAYENYRQHYTQHASAARELLNDSELSQQELVEKAAYTMLASTLLNLDETITRQ